MSEAGADFNTFEYVTGQQRHSQAALLADFETRNAVAAKHADAKLDIAYGAHPRQRIDVFKAKGAARDAILYLHPGYWQSRDKSGFRFLAAAFVEAGYDFALANYPLCPDVSLGALVEHVAEAIPFTLDYLGRTESPDHALIVAGHSAGAHLAVELALRTWPANLRGGRPIERVAAISGIYDLEPLISTPLNDRLQLSTSDARQNSPIHRARNVGIPAAFIVGGSETSEFRRQSRAMCEAWRNAGNRAVYVEAPGADHFSIIDDLASWRHPSLTDAFEF